LTARLLLLSVEVAKSAYCRSRIGVNLLAEFHHRRDRIGRMIGAVMVGGFRLTALRCAFVAVFAAAVLAAQPARAVEAVNVRLDASAIDITAATEVQKTEGDRI
jgi:hypothetical protein